MNQEHDTASASDSKIEKQTDINPRRRLLAALGAAGAAAASSTIPSKWSPPIVESLMLPAHAQTTPGFPPREEPSPVRSGPSPCTPDCTGRACGDDGCGGSCGSCGPGQICVNGVCVDCTPDCSGRACGDDGCGGSCGSCPPGQVCVNGVCVSA